MQPSETTREPGHRREAFTLLELLIVITIIAILSAIVVPVANSVVGMARRAAAGSNARQIALGLRTYAIDHGGRFPAGGSNEKGALRNANDAFRLIIDYVDRDERLFAVPGSAWGPAADGRCDTPEETLAAGENHFAYIAGLTSDSRGTWPLVVDGTDGSGGYTVVRGQRGGVWQGRYAVVARVDGGAEAVPLRGSGDRRYLPRHGDPERNALDVADYMGPAARLLDPAPAAATGD